MIDVVTIQIERTTIIFRPRFDSVVMSTPMFTATLSSKAFLKAIRMADEEQKRERKAAADVG